MFCWQILFSKTDESLEHFKLLSTRKNGEISFKVDYEIIPKSYIASSTLSSKIRHQNSIYFQNADPFIKAIFDEWDIAKTESILKDRELDDNLRAAKTQKRRDAEKKGKEDVLSQVQKEFDVAQKQVNKCYCEVEKPISEHDNAVIAGFEKLDITEGMVLTRTL